jgi:hypothetical protein
MRSFKQYAESMDRPKHVIPIDTLYHLGTFDPTQKRAHSYEGHALSVSKHPDAWRKIASLGGLPKHQLHNPNGQFLDFHRAKRDKKFMATVYQWGKQQGYVTDATVYHVSWHDEELDQEVSMSFDDYQRALEEAGYDSHEEYQQVLKELEQGQISKEDFDQEYRKIKAVKQPVMTPKLAQVIGWAKSEPNMTTDALLLAYAETMEVDGVWWNDQYDPDRYSAPRGGILPGKLANWKVTPADHHSDDQQEGE